MGIRMSPQASTLKRYIIIVLGCMDWNQTGKVSSYFSDDCKATRRVSFACKRVNFHVSRASVSLFGSIVVWWACRRVSLPYSFA